MGRGELVEREGEGRTELNTWGRAGESLLNACAQPDSLIIIVVEKQHVLNGHTDFLVTIIELLRILNRTSML